MKKILIVDDSREVRKLVGTTLSFKNFKIYEAPNGLKAVEMAEKYHPDLVIMDISMPGAIDGIEATRRIRALPHLSDTSVLILSGVLQDKEKELLEAGAVEVLSKPFSPLELISKVEKILGT